MINFVDINVKHFISLDEDKTGPKTVFVCRTLSDTQKGMVQAKIAERSDKSVLANAYVEEVTRLKKAYEDNPDPDLIKKITDLDKQAFIALREAQEANHLIFSMVVTDITGIPKEIEPDTVDVEGFGFGKKPPEGMNTSQIFEVADKALAANGLTEHDEKNSEEQSGSGTQLPDLTATSAEKQDSKSCEDVSEPER